MSNKIDNLFNECLEIEGLICLLNRRGDSTPMDVVRLLVKKSEKLHSALVEIDSNVKDGDKCETREPETSASLLNDAEPSPAEKETEGDRMSTDVEIAESVEFEETSDAVIEQTACDTELPEVSIGTTDGADAVVLTSQAIQSIEHEATRTVRNDKVTVELTINDKFRFRRELFGNSDVDLAEALQVAGQMSSVEEVEDYFHNDLCFDLESDIVKDFIKIVTNKF